MSQNDEIYHLLIARGNVGINSFEPLRNYNRQLPRIINDLESANKKWKLKGKIEHIRQKNTSMTYIYHPDWQGIPEDFSQEEKKIIRYEFIGNKAIPVFG